jgi:hypothetical protein
VVRSFFSYDFLDRWDSEPEQMNKNKNGGKPFIFPDSFILVIGYIRTTSFHLPYKQTERIIKASVGKRLPSNPPSYGHICKRG